MVVGQLVCVMCFHLISSCLEKVLLCTQCVCCVCVRSPLVVVVVGCSGVKVYVC